MHHPGVPRPEWDKVTPAWDGRDVLHKVLAEAAAWSAVSQVRRRRRRRAARASFCLCEAARSAVVVAAGRLWSARFLRLA